MAKESYKVTLADLKYFDDRVKHWMKVLSLGDWRVEVYRGETTEDASAECEMWRNSHGAHIRLRQTLAYKPERQWLDKLALHEVCHILLCDLKRLTTEVHSESQRDTAEHAVIRRLENALG